MLASKTGLLFFSRNVKIKIRLISTLLEKNISTVFDEATTYFNFLVFCFWVCVSVVPIWTLHTYLNKKEQVKADMYGKFFAAPYLDRSRPVIKYVP